MSEFRGANLAPQPRYGNREWKRGRKNVRIEEASMHTRFVPRLLVLGLMLTLVLTVHFRTFAAEQTTWTDTESVENGLVQACTGFNVTGSYTADRAHQIVENYYDNQVFERQNVTFTGTLGNAAAGKFYAYDGGYTRTANMRQGSEVIISNLSLQFEVDTPNAFTVSVPYVDFDLADNPQAVIKPLVPNVLRMDVCQLFGGSTIGYGPIIPSSHPSADINAENTALPRAVNVHTENSALAGADIETTQDFARSVRSKSIEENADLQQEAGASDDMTPWTELDPCDSSPPGKPC
jgi:hypothetical protein